MDHQQGPDPAARPGRRPAVVLDHAAGTAWRVLVLAAALVVVVLALVRLRFVVLPLCAALLATVALTPPVRWLARRMPRALATWLVLGGLALATLGAGVLFAGAVRGEVGDLGTRLDEGVEEVRGWLVDGPLGLSPDTVERGERRVRDELRTSLDGSRVASRAVLAVELLAGVGVAVVLLFFFLKDGERIRRWGLRQLPEARRPMAAALGRRAWAALAGYLRGTAIIGALEAVVVGVLLVLVGVPLVAPLVLLTFVAAFFPLVGAVAAGAVTTLVALVTAGPEEALVVGGVILVLQQLDGDVLQPVVMGPAVRLHPVVILLALTAGSSLAGIAGAFLAVPLTAVVVAVASEWRLLRYGPPAPLPDDPPTP